MFELVGQVLGFMFTSLIPKAFMILLFCLSLALIEILVKKVIEGVDIFDEFTKDTVGAFKKVRHSLSDDYIDEDEEYSEDDLEEDTDGVLRKKKKHPKKERERVAFSTRFERIKVYFLFMIFFYFLSMFGIFWLQLGIIIYIIYIFKKNLTGKDSRSLAEKINDAFFKVRKTIDTGIYMKESFSAALSGDEILPPEKFFEQLDKERDKGKYKIVEDDYENEDEEYVGDKNEDELYDSGIKSIVAKLFKKHKDSINDELDDIAEQPVKVKDKLNKSIKLEKKPIDDTNVINQIDNIFGNTESSFDIQEPSLQNDELIPGLDLVTNSIIGVDLEPEVKPLEIKSSITGLNFSKSTNHKSVFLIGTYSGIKYALSDTRDSIEFFSGDMEYTNEMYRLVKSRILEDLRSLWFYDSSSDDEITIEPQLVVELNQRYSLIQNNRYYKAKPYTLDWVDDEIEQPVKPLVTVQVKGKNINLMVTPDNYHVFYDDESREILKDLRVSFHNTKLLDRINKAVEEKNLVVRDGQSILGHLKIDNYSFQLLLVSMNEEYMYRFNSKDFPEYYTTTTDLDSMPLEFSALSFGKVEQKPVSTANTTFELENELNEIQPRNNNQELNLSKHSGFELDKPLELDELTSDIDNIFGNQIDTGVNNTYMLDNEISTLSLNSLDVSQPDVLSDIASSPTQVIPVEIDGLNIDDESGQKSLEELLKSYDEAEERNRELSRKAEYPINSLLSVDVKVKGEQYLIRYYLTPDNRHATIDLEQLSNLLKVTDISSISNIMANALSKTFTTSIGMEYALDKGIGFLYGCRIYTKHGGKVEHLEITSENCPEVFSSDTNLIGAIQHEIEEVAKGNNIHKLNSAPYIALSDISEFDLDTDQDLIDITVFGKYTMASYVLCQGGRYTGMSGQDIPRVLQESKQSNIPTKELVIRDFNETYPKSDRVTSVGDRIYYSIEDGTGSIPLLSHVIFQRGKWFKIDFVKEMLQR